MKKHFYDMTQEDVELLDSTIEGIDIASVQITAYTMGRMEQRMPDIELIDVAKVFIDYNILEYNITNNDKRVVLRGTNEVMHNEIESNIIIIYSILHNTIITAWSNDIYDLHETLDFSIYNRELEIIL